MYLSTLFFFSLLATLTSLTTAQNQSQQPTTIPQCRPAIQTDPQPQLFIMSDISNEPDDTMSFIRLLLHADQYNITGMVAVTSIWLNGSTYPDQIRDVVSAYGDVVDRLNAHSAGTFPTEEYLAGIVSSGPQVYGTLGVGRGGSLSSGSERLIEVVDGMADDGVLFCTAWGGINMLAETLEYISRTRPQLETDRFTKKLRIYSISDQDNAGPWIRGNFPQIPYIVSLHGFNQYGLATWTGISGDLLYEEARGGPDTSLVNQDYVRRNFQIGPLGSLYPDIAYIMEGDSPSFIHVMMNGLNGGPYDHPEWGGFGGRYLPQDRSGQNQVYSDARDNVTGVDGRWHISNQASIWRWRRAYQEEMSARMQWTLTDNYADGSHPPVLSLNGSCDSSALIIPVQPGQEVVLDASGSYDPDANLSASSPTYNSSTGSDSTSTTSQQRPPLQFAWFQYKEPSDEPHQTSASSVPDLNITLSASNRTASMRMPSAEEACYELTPLEQRLSGEMVRCMAMHVLVEVTGSGEPPIRRWKRAVLEVQVPDGGLGDESEDMRRKRDEL